MFLKFFFPASEDNYSECVLQSTSGSQSFWLRYIQTPGYPTITLMRRIRCNRIFMYSLFDKVFSLSDNLELDDKIIRPIIN